MKNAQKMVHNKQIVCTNPARDHQQIVEDEAHRRRASASDRALIDDLSLAVVPRRARSLRDRRPLMLEAARALVMINDLSLAVVPRRPRSAIDRRPLMLEAAPPPPLPVNGLPDHQLPHRKREIARRKIYSCNICGKSFEKYQSLGGHKAQHTKANKKMKLLAPLEGGSSRTSNANNLGVVVHAQSHRCELCGREFAKAQALAVHKRHCKNRVLRIRS